MDLKIASIAISIGAKLVTRNLNDFQRIPGIDAEDWLS
jgi:predicted nucleic acid-binding protein